MLPRTVASLSTSAIRPSLTHTTASLARPAAIQSQRRNYHEKVLDHYSNPRNVGSMNKNDGDVGTGMSAWTLRAGLGRTCHSSPMVKSPSREYD